MDNYGGNGNLIVSNRSSY